VRVFAIEGRETQISFNRHLIETPGISTPSSNLPDLNTMTHRGFVVACFFCSNLGAAAAATTGPVALDFTPFGAAHAAKASAQLAPADASFGPYDMTVLGIESAIRRCDGTTRLDDGPVAYALVAIRDWEARFPRDPWIPRELFYMQRLYQHAHTGEGFAYARRLAAWLQTDYPSTDFAALSGR
jgi:hypothetical protein